MPTKLSDLTSDPQELQRLEAIRYAVSLYHVINNPEDHSQQTKQDLEEVLEWKLDQAQADDDFRIAVWTLAYGLESPVPLCSVCHREAPLVDQECPDCRH